ncbi:MAG: hypothetical protein ACFFBD_25760, partial [Candidatus Hodarchaeota archaeon]
EPLLRIPENVLILMYYLGNIGFLLGMLGFSRMINHPAFPKIIRVLSKLSEYGYSMVFALNIADMFLVHPVFFLISRNYGEWQLSFHPLALILFIISTSFTIILAFTEIINPPPFYDARFLREKKIRIVLYPAIILCLAINSIFFLGMVYLNIVPFKLGFMIITPIVISLFSVVLYLSHTQPVFLLISGAQPTLFIRQGYIGYFLASFTDFGPAPILVSQQFKERMNISEDELANFSVGGLSATFSNSSVRKIALLPLLTVKDLVGLTFSFPISNPSLEDERLVHSAPSLFSIFFPSVMTFVFSNLSRVVPIVWEKIEEKETLTQLADSKFLEELTLIVLRKLLGS